MPAARPPKLAKVEVVNEPLKVEQVLSGYDGAMRSPDRGFIYMMSRDPRRDLDSYTQFELASKASWLVKNVGLARKLTYGVARKCGAVYPSFISGDAEWNRLAAAAFRRRALSAPLFSEDGKWDFKSVQLELNRELFKCGDNLTVKGRAENGGAQYAFFESRQIGNAKGDRYEDGWNSGVLLNQAGRHLGYRVLDPLKPGHGEFIDANHAVYYGNFDSMNNVRGVTPLAHAINHLVDITEILADTKHAIKASGLLGFLLTQGGTDDGDIENAAVPIGVDSDGNLVKYKGEVGQALASGGVAELPPGVKAEILTDTRPHPNQLALLGWLVRDISAGFDLPTEVIWDLATVGGTQTRWVMEDAQNWLDHHHDHRQIPWARAVVVDFIACEIRSGRLRQCTDDGWWWKIEFDRPRRISIDFGRDTAAHVAQRKSLMRSLRQHYEEAGGRDWRTALEQQVEECRAFKAMCLRVDSSQVQVTMDEVMRFIQGLPIENELQQMSQPDPEEAAKPA